MQTLRGTTLSHFNFREKEADSAGAHQSIIADEPPVNGRLEANDECANTFKIGYFKA